MLRASLRSVSDPLRDNICLLCLAQGSRARSRLHRLYNTTPYRFNQSNGGGDGGNEAADTPPLPKDSSIGLPPSNQDLKVEDETHPQKETRSHKNKKSKRPYKKSHPQKKAPVPSSSNDATLPKSKNKDVDKVQRRAKNGASAPQPDGDGDKDTRENSDSSAKNVQKGTGSPLPKQKNKKVLAQRARREYSKQIRRGRAARRVEQQTAGRSAAHPKRPFPNAALFGPKSKQGEGSASPESAVATDSGLLNGKDLNIVPLNVDTPPVPRLSFGLDRVLFNPGVYHLRDPRSRVFNFDPYLGSIMPVTEFDFTALKDYITSSRDQTLRDVATKERKKYVGSSSSMTSVLSQFHYLLSSWRPIDVRNMSQGFPTKLRTFTRLSRAPAAIILRYQDGVYAIDADKEFDSANILMNLGKSMEKLLTLPKEEFERYRRSSVNKITAEEEQAVPESYHYTTSGDFIMRSQLDAYDPRLPGTGMFDLKTRAAVSVRMDARNFEHGLGYEIKGRFGPYESFEREFFDMIRAAFLKYSLQVRVGRMDGIFVAFHNVRRIFGFQYISLPEMDQALHGQYDTVLGDTEFQLSLALWNKVLNKVTAKYPQRSLRLHFETREASVPFMYIFAEPVTDQEIEAIQNKNKADIDAYQRRILNLETDSAAPDNTETQSQASESTSNAVKSNDNKEASSTFGDSLKSGLKYFERFFTGSGNNPSPGDSPETGPKHETAISPDGQVAGECSKEKTNSSPGDSPAKGPNDDTATSASADGESAGEPKSETQEPRELFGMTLFIKNKVNGKFVDRPVELSASDVWTLEYELKELPPSRTTLSYLACQKRRERALAFRDDEGLENNYVKGLRALSKQGEEWRNQEDELDREHGVVVLGDSDSPQHRS